MTKLTITWPRDEEITFLLAQGTPTDAIADKIGVSTRTVLRRIRERQLRPQKGKPVTKPQADNKVYVIRRNYTLEGRLIERLVSLPKLDFLDGWGLTI